jgi:iron complex outermembrane receptor protein
LRGSYSVNFLNAARRAGSDDASTVRQLEGDSPSYTAVLQSEFRLPRNFDLNLVYRYVSAIPDQAVPSYSTGDARLAWRLLEQWELEVAGRNLLQPRHVEYGGDPGGLVAIEREVYAGVTFRH